MNIIEKHKERYLRNKKLIDHDTQNVESIMEIRNFLRENIITCVKYHYQLDKASFGQSCNHAFIELNRDCTYLWVYNKKQLEKDLYEIKNNPEVL